MSLLRFQPLKTKPLARAAKLIALTSEQSVPPKHRSRKETAEIARIAGRLLFTSLFNDLTHGATLAVPEKV
uniref:Uncharacterized protein n=1 Tax=Parascaris equorum TaxID=6256 RepID=A0A914RAE7_PAREQ